MQETHLISLLNSMKSCDLNNKASNEFTKITEFSCKVSIASIANLFQHLKSGKASGVDGLAAENFRYADDYVNVYLSLLFTSFFMPWLFTVRIYENNNFANY